MTLASASHFQRLSPWSTKRGNAWVLASTRSTKAELPEYLRVPGVPKAETTEYSRVPGVPKLKWLSIRQYLDQKLKWLVLGGTGSLTTFEKLLHTGNRYTSGVSSTDWVVDSQLWSFIIKKMNCSGVITCVFRTATKKKEKKVPCFRWDVTGLPPS